MSEQPDTEPQIQDPYETINEVDPQYLTPVALKEADLRKKVLEAITNTMSAENETPEIAEEPVSEDEDAASKDAGGAATTSPEETENQEPEEPEDTPDVLTLDEWGDEIVQIGDQTITLNELATKATQPQPLSPENQNDVEIGKAVRANPQEFAEKLLAKINANIPQPQPQPEPQYDPYNIDLDDEDDDDMFDTSYPQPQTQPQPQPNNQIDTRLKEMEQRLARYETAEKANQARKQLDTAFDKIENQYGTIDREGVTQFMIDNNEGNPEIAFAAFTFHQNQNPETARAQKDARVKARRASKIHRTGAKSTPTGKTPQPEKEKSLTEMISDSLSSVMDEYIQK